MNLAKQSTAKTFILGPILDSLGGAKTDEVVGSIKVTKNGTVGAVDAHDTLTHNHTGHYVFVSDGDDFGTLGEVEFSLNSGTNAMSPVKFQVVTANVYNALVAGGDYLDVAVAEQANIDFGALQKISLGAILDEECDNDGVAISLRQAMKLVLSVLTGLSTGGGTNTISFRDIANTKNRVRATVDANGNRTGIITRDGT